MNLKKNKLFNRLYIQVMIMTRGRRNTEMSEFYSK